MASSAIPGIGNSPLDDGTPFIIEAAVSGHCHDHDSGIHRAIDFDADGAVSARVISDVPWKSERHDDSVDERISVLLIDVLNHL